MKYTFDKNNHREQFKTAVTTLVSNEYPHAEKTERIDELTNEYVFQTGERPDHRELDELASWLIWGPKGLSLRKKFEIRANQDTLA